MNKQPRILALPQAEISLYENFIEPAEEAEKVFQALLAETPWRQDRVRIFGKWVDQPRLSAWYGDPGRSYRYSGLLLMPLTWTSLLLDLKAQIDALVEQPFNSVLLNQYRNGQDSMGWHSDDEPELGLQPVIASLSFGAPRRFLLRHRQDKNLKMELLLESGSLLMMQGSTQQHWQHSIPKSTKAEGERVNLTFRRIM